MYLCYVDESGDTGPRGSKHLLLGAAALFEGRWSYVSNDFSKVIGQYFPAPPRPKEIHCTDVRGGRGAYATLSRDQRMDLLADVAALMQTWTPHERNMQAFYIGRHLRDCACSTDDARELIEEIRESMQADTKHPDMSEFEG